jgi:hypothetical protein
MGLFLSHKSLVRLLGRLAVNYREIALSITFFGSDITARIVSLSPPAL